MPAGQPTLLTPTLLEDFRRILPTVLYLETVADYLSVDRTTWRKWLRRGSAEAKRLKKPRARPKATEAIYLEFFHTVKKCLAEGEIMDAGTIKKASQEQWQAAAWRLERRFPARWGRKDTINVREVDRQIEAEMARLAAAGQADPAAAAQGDVGTAPASQGQAGPAD